MSDVPTEAPSRVDKQRPISIPAWIFGDSKTIHSPRLFLLILRPDGTTEVDGHHSHPSDVAEAKRLYETLNIIRPPAGSRYLMLTISPVPEEEVMINPEAVETLNDAFAHTKPLSDNAS